MSGRDNLTFHFRNSLGMNVEVSSFGSAEDVLGITHDWGLRGFTCATIPKDGIELPYAMADKFNWALIGARHFTYKRDGEDTQAVYYMGDIYTRREWPENKARKMPAAISYSRGAKNEEKNPADDNIQYVALVIFKGNGPIIQEWCVPPPQGKTQERKQELPAPTASANRSSGRALSTAPGSVTQVQLERITAMQTTAPNDSVYKRAITLAFKEMAARPNGEPELKQRSDLSEKEAAIFIVKLSTHIAKLASKEKEQPAA